MLNRLRAQLNFDKRPPTNLTTIEVIHQQLERLVKENPNDECRAFTHEINTILKDWKGLDSSRQTPPVFELLRKSFVKDGVSGLHSKIRHLYYGRMAYREFSESNRSEQAKLADFRYPIEWYPATRMIQRVIHLHVGPTNSGKTYNALKRLEQAKCGIYAGPLRLLAHEIYLRLNAKGKACNLITGDERLIREDENVLMSSCTVEMVPLNNDIDVAVIDEIQMIGDEDRGWAWTQALLGLRARELHLCGEARVIPLIRELAAATGDKLEIHHYERLNPLKTMSSSLHGKFTALRKGDCVIAFSRVGIHALKAEIEKLTGRLVAVVYGSLPPEIRAQQARLFNDPDNEYDFLVASDAIGMGLNL